jgi:hypothetical protein
MKNICNIYSTDNIDESDDIDYSYDIDYSDDIDKQFCLATVNLQGQI